MTEEKEQAQLLKWFKMQYPYVRFNGNLRGIKLTIGQAKKLKAMQDKRGHPDMMFYKHFDDGINHYIGLAIELKRTGTKLIKNDGGFYSTNKAHRLEQLSYLNDLSKQGWCVCFCVGFEEAKKVIEEYMSNEYGYTITKVDDEFFGLLETYGLHKR